MADKYIKEEFEDKDSRHFTRVIKILDYARDKKGRIKTTLFGKSVKYTAAVVFYELKPHLVGRRTTVSAKTLNHRYVKISH